MKVAVWGFGHFANVLCCVLERVGCRAVRQEDLVPHLVRAGQSDGTTEPGYQRASVSGFAGVPDVIWAAYDVPLDEAGRSVDRPVVDRIESLLDEYPRETPVLLSCQWRVGTTAQLEGLFPDRTFIYVMENVRVGHAIKDFETKPLIVGTRDRLPLSVAAFLSFFTHHQMSPESAEMSKHALNGFLALNISYANEIASLCQTVGADARAVMDAVRRDARVSETAPLTPGMPFGGGSLLRDVLTLEELATQASPPGVLPAAPIIQSIRSSNDRPVIAPLALP